MAALTERDSGRRIADADAIAAFLAPHGIWYRRFDGIALAPEARADRILAAYAGPIEELRRERGYAAADVIDVRPDTPGLDRMLEKFATEHTHAEDEVRLVAGGRGLFHVHPADGSVFGIEVGAGDAINVPAGTRHWFHLCEERTIRAIRLFEDAAGWVPAYTGSGIEARYAPLCFGAPRR